MSKERARRREQRQAEAARRTEQARARAAKLAARRRRRERLRRALRAVLPYSPGQRYSRRTRGQRAAVTTGVFAVLVLVWLNTATWGPRIFALLAAVLLTPVLVTLLLDRSSR